MPVFVGSYLPNGPQTSVPVSTVTGGGWESCWSAAYSQSMTSSYVSSVLTTCNKNSLMLACRQTGSTTLTLLAWAPRADVIYDTGSGNTPHNAQGTGWYFSDTYSWGFANQGDSISRGQCDTDTSSNSNLRLCWHTLDSSVGGYRCGGTLGLNDATNYDKIIYHRNI